MTKKTILFETHKSLGATIVPFAGFDMPVSYQSIKEEIFAVRNSAGVFDVSHMGEFFVEGSDHARFVNSLLCNDYLNIPIGKALYSPLLNHEGKILDDLIAYKLSDSKTLICVNAGNIEKDWKWINQCRKETRFSQCNLINASEEYSLLALQGPDAATNLKKIIPEFTDSIDAELPYYGVIELMWNKKSPMIIARTGYTGEDGFELFIKNDDANSLWEKLLQKNVKPCGLGARDCLRLEVCYPLYGHELDDSLTPLDCALKWTVKMEGRNFNGRDGLLNYLPKFRLIKFFPTQAIAREGYEILDSDRNVIGRVTSGTMSPTLNKSIAMGLIAADFDFKIKPLFVKIRSQVISIEITQQNFLKGGHK